MCWPSPPTCSRYCRKSDVRFFLARLTRAPGSKGPGAFLRGLLVFSKGPLVKRTWTNDETCGDVIPIEPMAAILDVLRSMAGVDAPLAPFSAIDRCAGSLLLAAIGLLGAAWWAAVVRDDTHGRRLLAWAGAGLVATMSIRGLFVPFVVVAVFAAARTSRTLAAASAALVLAVLIATVWPAEPPARDPFAATTNPAAETLRWSRLGNFFWTRYWAAQWSSLEPEPGAGHLALARASWALGHDDDARRIATQVTTRAGDPEMRAQAAAVLATWQEARR
jgi:hypothetical protein